MKKIGSVLIVLSFSLTAARAQIIFPGSTVEGDYLRGVGVAAAGMGAYNYDSAVAGSINTDTAIRWNEYLAAVAKYQARMYAMKRQQKHDMDSKAYKEVRKRIQENPEERDVQNGDALNSVMEQLLDPAIAESAFRYEPVPLSVDVVTRIPFKLDKENLVFSMHRLTATGKDKWPPALQDPLFARERRNYERALDAVLEQQIEGKMTLEAMHAVEVAVDDLFQRLNEVVPPSSKKPYIEAKNRLEDFRKTASKLITSHRMELVIGQLDQYSGTTVRDLLVFMQKNKLGFAVADSPEEKGLYPELYASLVLQRDKVKPPTKKPAK